MRSRDESRQPSDHGPPSPLAAPHLPSSSLQAPDQHVSEFDFTYHPGPSGSSHTFREGPQTPSLTYHNSHERTNSIISPSHSTSSTRPLTSHTYSRSVPAIEPEQPSPRYEAISTTYPKPHDRPLPSNDQVLLHLPSDLGVTSFFDHSLAQKDPRTTRVTSLVKVDRSVLPSADHINHLLYHFETDISAAFPIFHMPTLKAWVDAVCDKGVPVESEVACAVLCQ